MQGSSYHRGMIANDQQVLNIAQKDSLGIVPRLHVPWRYQGELIWLHSQWTRFFVGILELETLRLDLHSYTEPWLEVAELLGMNFCPQYENLHPVFHSMSFVIARIFC